jgi:hypothetical protein
MIASDWRANRKTTSGQTWFGTKWCLWRLAIHSHAPDETILIQLSLNHFQDQPKGTIVMTNENHSAKWGALMAFGILVASASGVTAALASPTLAMTGGPAAPGADSLLQEAKVNVTIGINQGYNRSRHGRRCNFRHDDCRNYYRGSYYQNPWWLIPGIVGGNLIQNEIRDSRYANNHVRWCQDRYRSYNIRTNTWLSYSGQYRQCNSPY